MSAAPITALLLAVIVISACKSAPPGTPTARASQSATATPATTGNLPASFIASPDCDGLQHGILPIADLAISFGGAPGITLQVEVADETGERAQGLMCRRSIPPGTGMLFTYDTDRSSGFWMFNTYVPIDILYLDQSGRVVDNISMTPCARGRANGPEADSEWRIRCATEANDYVPSGPWRNTLELPAGWLEAQGMGGPSGEEITISWTTLNP